MSDPRLEAAIAHWAPRYVEHGVPVGDFLDVTRSIESWDDWCAAWTAARQVHEQLGDEALAQGYQRSAGDHHLTATNKAYMYRPHMADWMADQLRATTDPRGDAA